LYATELFLGSDNLYVKLANTGNIVVNSNDAVGNTAQWTFGVDGSLTFPIGISIDDNVDPLYPKIIADSGKLFSVQGQGANGSAALAWSLNPNTDTQYAAVGVNQGGGDNLAKVVLTAGNTTATLKVWKFDQTGVLSLPNGAVIRDTVGNAVSFGLNAGQTTQGNAAVAIGSGAGNADQGILAVAIGSGAGNDNQGNTSVAIGASAGYTDQGLAAIAIGRLAGYDSQGTDAVAIGPSAGNVSQGNLSVALGYFAGNNSQGQSAVAIGGGAGEDTQGEYAVAVGSLAGQIAQGNAAVAVGAGAGAGTQGLHAVAIGTDTGATTQGNRAVAIGYLAGSIAQGTAAVAIGYYAGELNQGNNSIIINATDTALQQTTANTFTVAPIRNDVANIGNVVFYNTTSKEVTYGNTISVAGNVTGGNILTAGFISVTGNITAGNLSVTGNVTGNTAGFAIGYRDIPQVAFTANTTIAATDAGKHYYSTLATANALTIANNTSVPWTVGTAITVINRGTGNIIITQDSGVSLYLAGNATSGNRTISTYGMATLLNVAANIWMINGTGVS
jgi:hypothetical protein